MNRFTSVSFFIAMFIFSLQAFAIEVDHGLSSPESVAMDENAIYVSNVGEKLEPSKKDGDGYISKLSLDGKMLVKKFLPATSNPTEVLHAPKGMVLVENILYVADIDRLKGYNLKNRKKVFDLSFQKEKTLFLNDITLHDESTLFLSATDTSKIYEVSLKRRGSYKELKLKTPTLGPNGLYFSNRENILYGVEYGTGGKPNGKVFAIDFKDKENPALNYLSDYQGYLDGIALYGDFLFFSDWVSFEGLQGKMMRLNLKTKELSQVKEVPGVGGPADFWLDTTNKKLYLPRMMESKLSILNLAL